MPVGISVELNGFQNLKRNFFFNFSMKTQKEFVIAFTRNCGVEDANIAIFGITEAVPCHGLASFQFMKICWFPIGPIGEEHNFRI